MSGILSAPFNISNGTRQGCPLSPLIFNLLMEPLAIYIRTHPNIKGFPICKHTHSISLFADDIVMIMTEAGPSLAATQEALTLFNQVSYYKVNDSKSYILGLGIDTSTSNMLKTQYPYTWSYEGIKYLGITLKANVDRLVEDYSSFLRKLTPKLQDLHRTESTWSGHLAAFKMMLLPQFIYLFRALPVPESFFNTAQSMINKFLWQGRKARCAFQK